MKNLRHLLNFPLNILLLAALLVVAFILGNGLVTNLALQTPASVRDSAPTTLPSTLPTPNALTLALRNPLTRSDKQVTQPQITVALTTTPLQPLAQEPVVQEPVVIVVDTTVVDRTVARTIITKIPLATSTATMAPTQTPSATSTPAPTITPSPTPTPTLTPTPHELDTTTNILVLGSDRREGDAAWRTDVIMIVALDTANARAGIISIPRDVYLDEIPGHKPNRINVVDVLGQQDDPKGGGPALLATILADNLGVRIDHYVRFEFESFKELVDALGGVRISLDCPVLDEIEAEELVIDLAAGEHLLDGNEALAFVRTRRQGGDLARVRRQQQLIWAIRQQMREENWLTRVPALYSALEDSVQTDIGVLKTVDLARAVMNLNEERIYALTLASPDLIEPAWRNGMSIFLVNWPAAAQDVQSVFERPQFEDETGGNGAGVRCP